MNAQMLVKNLPILRVILKSFEKADFNGAVIPNLDIFRPIGVDSPIGLALWSLCSSNPQVKSSLLVKAKFSAGNANLDKLLVSVPKPTEAVKIALYLSKVKFDS
jgi:hypothetical protein